MRWPRLSRRPEDSTQSRNSSSSSSSSAQGDKVTSPAEEHDPVIARLFSDAASFNRILNTHPEVGENAEDSREVHDSLNGFSKLVGCDLNDDERVASEKLAQLSVTNWGPEGTTTLAPDAGDESEAEEGASDDEQDKVAPSVTAQAGEEPEFEDKLASNEVLDLLQNEFGALAPPGEEKLLVETDATIFQDVVILVRSFVRGGP